MYSKTIPAGLVFCIFLSAFTAAELLAPNDNNADGLNRFRMFNDVSKINAPSPAEVLVWGNIEVTRDHRGKNIIQWSTLKENNTREFLIQYSANGHTFRAFKRIVSAGNSNKPYQYKVIDKKSKDHNYYRIIGIDNEGKVFYSKVVN